MLEIVRRIDFGMALHQQAHDFVVPGTRRHEQGRFAHSVAGINRRTGSEQRLHKKTGAGLCRPMQRRCSVGQRTVGIGSGVEEHPGNVQIPTSTRHQQRRFARIVRRIELRFRGRK